MSSTGAKPASATKPEPARRWSFGNAELDERSLVLKIEGRAVAIEPKPLEVLICLLERAGEVVTKDALMRAAWPGRIIADVTLAKTLARLRDALGDKDQNVIKTHHRYGYRLIAPLHVETLDRTEPAREAQETQGAARRETEHRPLTVLFCDLVESTQLADSLEPEAFRELLVNYQRRAADICARYEGHLAPQAGDGLLMYFGYPTAHDDDAERALRCACELIAAPAQADAGTRLALRVGVHTSTVLIGCTGSGSEPLATGAGLHLAARLQALAEPDTVLMSEATFRLVPGLFVTRDFGPQIIRGLGEPVRVHQAIQPSGVRSRLEAAATLTPYAGRERETEMLGASWQAAVRGEGRALLISGEPGLGKSRLLLELREQLSGGAFTWLECRASALTRHSTWQPWVELLRRGLSFRDGDSNAQRLARLEHSLDALGMDQATVVPLLAPLLSLDLPTGYATAQLGPKLKRKRTLEALVSWVLHQAQQQPLVLVFEDLHWADDSSLDCLGLLLKQLADMPMLLLMTARTEFVARWLQHRWLHFLTLDPLPASGVEQMLETLSENRALTPTLRALVHQRAGGVPLFVEELTRALIESGDAARDAQAIPTSLRALLMARLDRLGPARELSQIAAVVGREISHALLAHVAGLDDASLARDLRRLTDSGMLHARGTAPDATYVFKHALIQDAAYEILLKPRRQTLHGRIAQTLEAQFPERARNEPEVLALHFEKAGLIEPAVRYGSRAASKAIAASAYREAIQHAEHALQLLSGGERDAASTQLELALLVDLGSAKLALLGRGHPELLPILARTQGPCALGGDSAMRARALSNLALMYGGMSDYPQAAVAAEQLIALGQQDGNAPQSGVGHAQLSQVHHMLGEFDAALRQADLATHAFADAAPAASIPLLGVDGLSLALVVKAISAWFAGYPDQALALNEQAMTRAQSTGHVHTLSATKSRVAWIHLFRREPETALALANEGIAYAERYGYREWRALALLQAGTATGLLGRCNEGLALLHEAHALRQTPGPVFESWGRCMAAQVLLGAGRYPEARESLALALAVAQKHGQHNWEADIHRIRGELILTETSNDASGAEVCFRQALAVARSQQTRSMELRAATSLARLWQRQGRGQEADALLRPVYDQFTEGFDTPDLIDAAALLGGRCPAPNKTAARTLATEDAHLRARALVNLALMHGGFGDYAGYLSVGQSLAKLGHEVGNKIYEGVGHTLMSQASHMVGEILRSNEHTEQALRAFENEAPDSTKNAGELLGIDGRSAARLINATVRWFLGYPDQARSQNDAGWTRAESPGHPQTISSAMSRVAWVPLFRREPQLALERAQAAVTYADRYGYGDWKSFALLQEGIATTMLGRFDEGLALIRAYQSSCGLHRALYAALSRGFEAQACLWAGKTAEARKALDAAFAASNQHNERHWDAELHRLQGELRLAENPDGAAGAETCFRQALDVSRAQQARSLELRAATSLARLWQRTGRGQEADALLRPIYAWFTEGFDTPDLMDAAALLRKTLREQ